MRGAWKATAVAVGLLIIGIAIGAAGVRAQTGAKPDPPPSSYLPVNEEDFGAVLARMLNALAGTPASKAAIQLASEKLIAALYR